MTLKEELNITIIGGGYVGLSLACMLSSNNAVKVLDIDAAKVDMINRHISPLAEKGISDWFRTDAALRLLATTDQDEAFADADIVFIAVPTDFDESRSAFDTTHVEKTIENLIEYNDRLPEKTDPIIVIKSTIPIGFTAGMRSKTGCRRLLFAPEFLREGKALEDSLSPSRIIIGADKDDPDQMQDAQKVLQVIKRCCVSSDCPTLIVNSSDAEAIKLFSNTYLALRVAFFNELDSLAESAGLNARDIIDGMGTDPRIGYYYNNPSFGYGGYCLPKDTRQLHSHYADVPEKLFTAVVESNDTRLDFIADQILRKAEQLREQSAAPEEFRIGIYRLNMKSGSDNFRQSATTEVVKRLACKGYTIEVYEPLLGDGFEGDLPGCTIQKDLDQLKSSCGIIVANRFEPCLEDVKDKLYTRDLFHNN